MEFGHHVSIAGGVFNAPANAATVGGEIFQMFTRSPRGGNAPKLTDDIVDLFKTNCQKFGFKHYYVHTPYYINFASTNQKIYQASIRIIREELERSSLLGVKAVMTHLGSSKDTTRAKAIDLVAAGLIKALTGYQGTAQFLIEIAAGSGNVIGDTFDEIATIIKKVQPKVKTTLGVCFDTAHAFASGYDLRTKQAVNKTFDQFDQLVGLEKLILIHGNDSLVDFGARVDRHWHIGQGKIGLEGFRSIINHPKLKKVDMILETPDYTWDKKNLMTVKKIRDAR
ncbi:MAG: deoxyribonuclease IV [Candidatus Buchananbacteria bacterium]|nr:deoxyribonuclease IV [Candidatus Buchananbacteria bacterium]